jgi:hypothetical protein
MRSLATLFGRGEAVFSEASSRDAGNIAALHDWHQRLGMAAHHRLLFVRYHGAGRGIEHGGRTSFQRGVDGKNAHSTSYVIIRKSG